ncbi:hypothetical protein TWF569_004926 [Orbilia oligospora]|nr:hypothetical protein TWF569_004926 [Orbilia oligospora]
MREYAPGYIVFKLGVERRLYILSPRIVMNQLVNRKLLRLSILSDNGSHGVTFQITNNAHMVKKTSTTGVEENPKSTGRLHFCFISMACLIFEIGWLGSLQGQI